MLPWYAVNSSSTLVMSLWLVQFNIMLTRNSVSISPHRVERQTLLQMEHLSTALMAAASRMSTSHRSFASSHRRGSPSQVGYNKAQETVGECVALWKWVGSDVYRFRHNVSTTHKMPEIKTGLFAQLLACIFTGLCSNKQVEWLPNIEVSIQRSYS